jgi:peptidyl-prolyl cis-trans isomerase SurA
VSLTGCGVAGTSFQPGVAAEVDGQKISTDRVDRLVGDYCDAVREQLQQDGSVVPLGYLRSGVVGQLALVSAAEQLAAEHGVDPTQDYERVVTDLEAQTRDLPEDQRDAVVEVNGSSAYVQAVQLAVGDKLLGEEGEPSGPEAAGQRGADELNAWLDDHDIDINPEFGIAFEDGQVVSEDTQLAFAVGDTATTSALEAPDQEYAKSLPASQRCS